MISESKFFGKCHTRSIVADYTLTPPFARNYVFQANAPSLNVLVGYPRPPWWNFGKLYTIANKGTVNAFTIMDHSGNGIDSLNPGQAADVFLLYNGTLIQEGDDILWEYFIDVSSFVTWRTVIYDIV